MRGYLIKGILLLYVVFFILLSFARGNPPVQKALFILGLILVTMVGPMAWFGLRR